MPKQDEFKPSLPWWEKYSLSLQESAVYFGIGYKKLKKIVDENEDESFILWVGNRPRIKKDEFADYLNYKVNKV